MLSVSVSCCYFLVFSTDNLSCLSNTDLKLCCCIAVCPSVCQSACLSVRLSVCPSVRLSVCLFVCLSVFLVSPVLFGQFIQMSCLHRVLQSSRCWISFAHSQEIKCKCTVMLTSPTCQSTLTLLTPRKTAQRNEGQLVLSTPISLP